MDRRNDRQQKDINFVGNGWQVDFDNGGTIYNLEIEFEKLEDLVAAFGKGKKIPSVRVWKDRDGNRHTMVRVTVCELREQNPNSGATHYVKENDYEPKPREDRGGRRDRDDRRGGRDDRRSRDDDRYRDDHDDDGRSRRRGREPEERGYPPPDDTEAPLRGESGNGFDDL